MSEENKCFCQRAFWLCGIAVKHSTPAVLQLQNGWCLEKVSILSAYKENEALECFRGAAIWKRKLLFSQHSLLPMVQHSKPASEYLPVTRYTNMHRHIYSREYIGLIRKETYIHFVFLRNWWAGRWLSGCVAAEVVYWSTNFKDQILC